MIQNQLMNNGLELCKLLTHAGYVSCLAGGCVRDFIIGKTPNDIDIATVATPNQVIEYCANNGIRCVLTGYSHGTVTVIYNDITFEVTTLRIDKETDGRHSIVEYTDDWCLDSLRRDFTINSIFMDIDGSYIDYHNGIEDLKNGIVRYIGDAQKRIDEDHLRILRYFRFVIRFGYDDWMHTIDGKLSLSNFHKLKNISVERIWKELKIIVNECKRDIKTTSSILTKILQKLNSDVFNSDNNSFVDDRIKVYTALKYTDNPVTICNILGHNLHKLKMSSNEVFMYKSYYSIKNEEMDLVDILIKYGFEQLSQYLIIEDRISDLQYITTLKLLKNFPVSGKDLLDIGYTNQQIGNNLFYLKGLWLLNNYSKEELLKLCKNF